MKTAKEWYYSRYANGSDDEHNGIYSWFERMEEYSNEQNMSVKSKLLDTETKLFETENELKKYKYSLEEKCKDYINLEMRLSEQINTLNNHLSQYKK